LDTKEENVKIIMKRILGDLVVGVVRAIYADLPCPVHSRV
jgi:hypothetical protein